MKLRLLLFAALLLGIAGAAWADEVEITGGTEYKERYHPVDDGFFYNLSEQIYTAEELGRGGTISSVAFFNVGTERTRNIDIYLVHTAKDIFEGQRDWVPIAAGDLVFSGEVTFINGDWTYIEFSQKLFAYNGIDNLVLAVYDHTGSCSLPAGMKFRSFYLSPRDIVRTLYSTNEYNPYDLTNLSEYWGNKSDVRNVVRFHFESDMPRPIDFTVSEVGEHNATLDWSEMGDATHWQVSVNGDVNEVINVSSHPYTLTGLTNGSQYTVKVRSKNGVYVSDWSREVIFTTPLCDSYKQHVIRYELYKKGDSDGWHGNAIRVVDVTSGNILATWTINSVSNWNDGTLALCPGQEVRFEWVMGDDTEECKYWVYGPNNTVMFTGEGAMSEPFTYSVSIPNPANFAVTEVGATTATLNWTGDNDSYRVRFTTRNATTVFSDNFENGLDKWTILTLGEHPFETGWTIGHYLGSYVAEAWSWYSNPRQAYHADNWLITPKVALGGELTFKVAAGDAQYPDKYEVLLSTTDTRTESFTISLQDMAPTPAYQDFTTVSIDLSNYSGQEGYIAFHHADYDACFVAIDDVSITSRQWSEVITLEPGMKLTGLEPATTYEVLMCGLSYGKESEWTDKLTFTTKPLVKGDVNGDGSVNSDDVTELVHILLSGGTGNLNVCDVNNDDRISISDVTKLINTLLER